MNSINTEELISKHVDHTLFKIYIVEDMFQTYLTTSKIPLYLQRFNTYFRLL